jgi:Flp pilus assembly protein TadD
VSASRSLKCIPVLAAILLALCFPVRLAAQQTDFVAIQKLIDRGQLDQAGTRLRQILSKSPDSAKANELMGSVHLGQGNYALAEKSFRKALAAAPSRLQSRIGLAESLAGAGQFDSARDAYQDAAKLPSADPRPRLGLARLFLAHGDFQQSMDAASAIPPEKRTLELLPVLAAAYFGLKQPEKAAVEIQGMLRVAPKQPELIPELGEFFIAHGDFKSAEQLFTLAASQQPSTVRYEVDRAKIQAGLGQLNEAQQTLEAVFAKNPESVEALAVAGHVAALQQDLNASVEAFARANTLAPNRPEILAGLVSGLLYAGKSEEALAPARKLQSLRPDDLRATYYLALAEYGVRNWQQARAAAEKVVAEHPDDREMNLVLADTAFNDQKDLALARKYLAVCLRLNPDDPSALYFLGMVQRMEGDAPGALQNFAKSVQLNPKNADAQAALGSLALQTGDVPRAISALEAAVAIAPQRPENHYQLGLAYSRAGESSKASSELDQYKRMKDKEEREAKTLKGPTTSELPPMGIASRP